MFGQNSFVTVWEVKPVMANGQQVQGCCDARCSTASKNRDGNYEGDWQAYVRFYNTKNGGDAATRLLSLRPDPSRKYLAKIKLGTCGVKNKSVKQESGKYETYTNYLCWGFDWADDSAHQQNRSTQQSRPIPSGFIDVPDGIGEEELPF